MAKLLDALVKDLRLTVREHTMLSEEVEKLLALRPSERRAAVNVSVASLSSGADHRLAGALIAWEVGLEEDDQDFKPAVSHIAQGIEDSSSESGDAPVLDTSKLDAWLDRGDRIAELKRVASGQAKAEADEKARLAAAAAAEAERASTDAIEDRKLRGKTRAQQEVQDQAARELESLTGKKESRDA